MAYKPSTTLPEGWTVTEYPSYFQIADTSGKYVGHIVKPYNSIPFGELLATFMKSHCYENTTTKL
jgi:hypothetical protein